MGGYQVGKGVGKNDHGTVEPVLPQAGREKQEGIGKTSQKREKPKQSKGSSEPIEKLKRQKLDEEDK